MPSKRNSSAGTRRHALRLAAIIFLASGAALSQTLPLKRLDAYIEQARVQWEVPGLAVAMVKDDSVIFAKGYGVRELGKPGKVDAHTLFAVASNTKAFTAALLGLLVEAGKLNWEDRVVQHLPGFQMYDPYVTRELNLIDLLTHRSGLPVYGGDHLWIGAQLDREEIMRRLRYLEPNAPLRAKFQYQNLMFLVAGQVIPAVTDTSWDDFVQARLLQPLGMRETVTSIRFLAGRDNVAAPHEVVQGKIAAIPYDSVDATGPAGSLNSNVIDMAQWLRLQLGKGVYRGRRLLSESTMRMLHTQHMPIPVTPWAEKNFGRHFSGYGLGWFMYDYRGQKVMSHGGGLSGMFSLQTWLPDKNFGLIILTNFAPHDLTDALTYRILDAVLGAAERDWSADFLRWRDEQREREARAEAELQAQRVAGTRPSLALEAYAGTYFDEFSGAAQVKLVNGKLVFYYNPRHTGEMEHWHYDTFRLTWHNPIYDMPKTALVTFFLDEAGRVEKLKTVFYDPIYFKRMRE